MITIFTIVIHILLTRRSARIGIGYGIDVLGIHGVPRIIIRVVGTLRDRGGVTFEIVTIIIAVRLRPAVVVVITELVTSFEVSILTIIGSSTLPSKRTTRRKTPLRIGYVLHFSSFDNVYAGL